MTFLALVITLAFEQFRPMHGWTHGRDRLEQFLLWARRHLDSGKRSDGVVAWCMVILPLVIFMAIAGWLLASHPLLYLAWTCVALYFTMGFRQFSAQVSQITKHLEAGDTALARKEMASWVGQPVEPDFLMSSAIQQALVRAQHHVFSPLVWAIVLGPIGPVLYRLSHFVANTWKRDRFGDFSHRALNVLVWLSARVTAMGFALAGNFTEAIDCWRHQANQRREKSLGVLMASSAGALGLVIQEILPNGEPGGLYGNGENSPDDPNIHALPAAITLAWRTLVLLILLLGLMTLAVWWGRLTNFTA